MSDVFRVIDEKTNTAFFGTAEAFAHYAAVTREPEMSEWVCHMFGEHGITYRPRKGGEPNWLARWMMRLFFDCRWVKKQA